MDLILAAQNYYNTLQQAFKTKKIDLSKLLLSDTIQVVGPNESFVGKKNVSEMLEKLFIPAVSRFDIKNQYSNPNAQAVCTILDCVVQKSNKKVPTIELLFFNHGKIEKLLLFYDPQEWQKALE